MHMVFNPQKQMVVVVPVHLELKPQPHPQEHVWLEKDLQGVFPPAVIKPEVVVEVQALSEQLPQVLLLQEMVVLEFQIQ
jgi:hypothetical protein